MHLGRPSVSLLWAIRLALTLNLVGCLSWSSPTGLADEANKVQWIWADGLGQGGSRCELYEFRLKQSCSRMRL